MGYLARLQEIHPDKNKSNEMSKDSNKTFRELQQAWDNYQDMAKAMKKVQSTQSDFTKFGVGCSFSDNEEERALRTEITAQACRGWFSSGLLAAADNVEKKPQMKANLTSLVDDDLFVEVSSQVQPTKEAKSNRAPKTLIPNYKPTPG